MARSLQFVFRFPPVRGVFDMGHGIVYIFGELPDAEVEEVLNHETLHYVLQKVAGKRVSLKLDRIYYEVFSD